MYGTGLPLREPEQVCEACGAQGTIGRATRFNTDGSIMEMHRFCRACWPEERARYRARWQEMDRVEMEQFFRNPESPTGGRSYPSTSFEGASWHTGLELFEMWMGLMKPRPAPTEEELEGMAEQFRSMAAQIDEPMPMMIEAFVRKYGRPG
jgi:hypothetical protein